MADLYSLRKDGWYYYTYGVNFRAYAAYIAGIIINVVGFAGASESFVSPFIFLSTKYLIAGRTVPIAATRIYEMSFFTGFGVSAIVYYLLNVAFPVPGKYANFEEIDVSEEEVKVTSDDVSSQLEEDIDNKKGSRVDQEIYEA